MVKMTLFYDHPEDGATFEKYYADTHLAITATIPNVERVELTKFIGTPDGSAPSQYRIAEVYFESIEVLQASMGSEEGKTPVGDVPNFATGGVDIMIGEVVE